MFHIGTSQEMEQSGAENKLLTPEEAVKRYIKNRSQIALGGGDPSQGHEFWKTGHKRFLRKVYGQLFNEARMRR